MIDVPRTPAAAGASTDLPPGSDRDLGFGPPPRTFEAGAVGTAWEPAAQTTQAEPAVAEPEPEAETAPTRPEGEPDAETVPALPEPDLDLADPSPENEPTAPEPTAWDQGPEPWEPESDQHDDVDRFSLAREFGELLQRGEDPADG